MRYLTRNQIPRKVIDGIAFTNPFYPRAKRLNYWISASRSPPFPPTLIGPRCLSPDNRLTRQEELRRTAPETRENDRGTVFRFKLRMIAESRQIGTRRDSPISPPCLRFPRRNRVWPWVPLLSSAYRFLSLTIVHLPRRDARTCIEITRRNVYTRGE